MKNSASFAQLLTKPSLRADIDRELATRHLGEFVRQAWAVVEPSTPFVPGWHIDAIVEHLEAVSCGQIRNLLINVPPRHMKSLLVKVRWFSFFAATMEKKDQTTSGNDQNAADPYRFRSH